MRIKYNFFNEQKKPSCMYGPSTCTQKKLKGKIGGGENNGYYAQIYHGKLVIPILEWYVCRDGFKICTKNTRDIIHGIRAQ